MVSNQQRHHHRLSQLHQQQQPSSLCYYEGELLRKKNRQSYVVLTIKSQDDVKSKAFRLPRRKLIDDDDDDNNPTVSSLLSSSSSSSSVSSSVSWHDRMVLLLEKEYRKFLFLGACVRVSYCDQQPPSQPPSQPSSHLQPYDVQSISLVTAAPDPNAIIIALQEIVNGTLDMSVVMGRSMEEIIDAMPMSTTTTTGNNNNEEEEEKEEAYEEFDNVGGDGSGGGNDTITTQQQLYDESYGGGVDHVLEKKETTISVDSIVPTTPIPSLSLREKRARFIRRIQGVAQEIRNPRKRRTHIRRSEIQLLHDLEEQGRVIEGQHPNNLVGSTRPKAWKLVIPTPVSIIGVNDMDGSEDDGEDDYQHGHGSSSSSSSCGNSRSTSASPTTIIPSSSSLNMVPRQRRLQQQQQKQLPHNLPKNCATESANGRLSRIEYLNLRKGPQTMYFLQRLEDFVTKYYYQNNIDNNTGDDENNNNNNCVHNTSDTTTTNHNYHVLDVGGGRGDLATRIALAYKTQPSDVDGNSISDNNNKIGGNHDDDNYTPGADYRMSTDNTHHQQRHSGDGGSVVVTVVDKNLSSLLAGQDYARQLGLMKDTINFIYADFAEYCHQFYRDNNINDCNMALLVKNVDGKNDDDNIVDDVDGVKDVCNPQELQKQQNSTSGKVDMVVALHACGDLSDLALDFACRVGADFMVCPCCYTKRYISHFEPPWCQFVTEDRMNTNNDENDGGENNQLDTPVPNDMDHHNSNNKDFSAAESARAPPPTVDNILGRLAELDNRPDISQRAQTIINSMRMAAIRDWYDISLENYQGNSSKRNTVLVGTRRKR